MISIDQTLPNIKVFFDKVIGNIIDAGIDITDFIQIDHMAYRTETIQEYEEMKETFAKSGKKISERTISGRPIAIFKLQYPMEFNQFKIPCLELPAPKENSFHKSGLEHIEVVVENLDEFKEMYQHIHFQENSPSPENKELVLKFGDGTAVKFHEKSIEEIVKLEEN